MALSTVYVRGGLLILVLGTGCRGKLPTESTLLNPPKTEQIGTIPARENLLRALMASHTLDWSNSEQYFNDAYRSDPHSTIVELHSRTQQASNPVQKTSEDQ